MVSEKKVRSVKNKTLYVDDSEVETLKKRLLKLEDLKRGQVPEGSYQGDYSDLLRHIPERCVKLLFLDPPYNLDKDFNGKRFSKCSAGQYEEWLDELLSSLASCLSSEASIYICGDWFSSVSIFQAASKHFIVRNRITWEREKGRGARTNWKNSSEDIWFCTVSDTFTFNVDQVKLRRKVIAPYRDAKGDPKDWSDTAGGAYRDTHPSNLWTDITIPFWSMQENTDHPTQKSEKLLARLILASTEPGDLVYDPFLGSGTTSVVARKLGRRYLGSEQDETYCLLAEKRLQLATQEPRIQGFADGVFWERNTLSEQLAFTNKND